MRKSTVSSGERFEKYFFDFIENFGIRDMYSGGFYPFATPEEHWAYWSRYIYINRYMDAPKPVYETLLNLVADKDYFVITTNVDHCFQKAGFDKKRLFYTQGDYGLFQCSEPCCQETFENEAVIREMMERQDNMKIPTELLPVCPHCGKPLTMNLRSDDNLRRTRAGIGRRSGMRIFSEPVQAEKFSFWNWGAATTRLSSSSIPSCR